MNRDFNVDERVNLEIGEVIERYNQKKTKVDSNQEIDKAKEELKNSQELQRHFLDEVNDLIINTIEPAMSAMKFLNHIVIQPYFNIFVQPIVFRKNNTVIKFDITLSPTLSKGEIYFEAEIYKRVVQVRTLIYKCAGNPKDIINVDRTQRFFQINEIDKIFVQRTIRDLITELIR
jgi:hypothetical protein